MLTIQQIESTKEALKAVDDRKLLALGIYNAITHVYKALNELRDRRLAEMAETESRKDPVNASSSQVIIDNSLVFKAAIEGASLTSSDEKEGRILVSCRVPVGLASAIILGECDAAASVQISMCPRQSFGAEGPTDAERKAIEDAGLACPVPYLQPQKPPQ